jgi:hypothetical protein
MTDKADIYLVWSNEHRGWWRHGSHGYTPGLRDAGRYGRDQALEICRNAIPTAMHIGMISEIPVRLVDVEEFLKDQMVPAAILRDIG